MRGSVDRINIPNVKIDPMKELAERCMKEASELFPYKEKKKKTNPSHQKIGRTKEQIREAQQTEVSLTRSRNRGESEKPTFTRDEQTGNKTAVNNPNAH